MPDCIKCGKPLLHDEVGIYKKLVNRAADKFLCKECLAEHFEVDVSDIDAKIKQYKELGCTLFA